MFSAVKTMLAIVAIVFTTELVIMTGFSSFPYELQTSSLVLFLDPFLLSLVTAPVIYWLVLVPIHK